MSLGLQAAGFTVLRGYDSWPCAVDTYTQNLGHDAKLLDLGDLGATFLELEQYELGGREFPIVVGGPPCQDFSSAGHRVEGARADLTEKFAAIISKFRPPLFVMENVARARHAAAFKSAVSVMEGAGYHVQMAVLDASLYGAPQSRKRLVTIGTQDRSLTEQIFQLIRDSAASRSMTVRDALGESLGVEAYYRHPRSYARRAIFSIDEPSPTIRGVNRPMPPAYQQHPGDASAPSEVRALTLKERAAIQTFPPGFMFVGSRTNAEQMVGNAVPPKLAEHIGNALAHAVALQPSIIKA